MAFNTVHAAIPRDVYCDGDAVSTGTISDLETVTSLHSTNHPTVPTSRQKAGPIKYAPQPTYSCWSESMPFSAPPVHSRDNQQVTRLDDIFEDMGYPQDNTENDDTEDYSQFALKGTTPAHSRFPNVNFRSFRRRKISNHSRLEMWNHQLGKPLRVLSSGFQFPAPNLPPCFGRKVLSSVICHAPAADEHESSFSIHSAAGYAEEDDANHSAGHGTPLRDLTEAWDENVECRELNENCATTRDNDPRWTLSRAGLPVETPVVSNEYQQFVLFQSQEAAKKMDMLAGASPTRTDYGVAASHEEVTYGAGMLRVVSESQCEESAFTSFHLHRQSSQTRQCDGI